MRVPGVSHPNSMMLVMLILQINSLKLSGRTHMKKEGTGKTLQRNTVDKSCTFNHILDSNTKTCLSLVLEHYNNRLCKVHFSDNSMCSLFPSSRMEKYNTLALFHKVVANNHLFHCCELAAEAWTLCTCMWADLPESCISFAESTSYWVVCTVLHLSKDPVPNRLLLRFACLYVSHVYSLLFRL